MNFIKRSVMLSISLILITTAMSATAVGTAVNSAENSAESSAWSEFVKVADYIEIKADRVGGSEQEKQTAEWIASEWKKAGYEVTMQAFSYTLRTKNYNSQNLFIDIKGQSDKLLVVGAHYDSVGVKSGSQGLIDNGSGVAALLSLADLLSANAASSKENTTLPYTVRLIAFGAEERGLQGSVAYVNNNDTSNMIGMINLDTIIGGDKLYVHSAHSKPYRCDYIKEINYVSGTELREGIRAVSTQLYPDTPHLLHQEYKGYPEGETGSWSDHSPFACSGVTTAYIEATNFALNGKRGNDGYSQVADKAYWDCFDEKNLTSCNRDDEKAWGEIWHTKFDKKTALFPVMKEHLKNQQQQNVKVLLEFVKQANKWVK
ncbi:M28 family metallopeptidase [Psychrosphaera aestuarii]|uniref:M28 family metallopeptidase n=1 Tax=Psychrosphaera aestuarii TaxID=1266052 RepID=UPI001B332843|nr:M28 family peptidase [Psychrosphaera aestuarii]